MAVWIPNGQVSSFAMFRSEPSLEAWEHVADDPASIDGLNLANDTGSSASAVEFTLDGSGVIFNATLILNAVFLGGTALSLIVLKDGEDWVYSNTLSFHQSGYKEIPLTLITAPRNFTSPRLLLSFNAAIGEAGMTLEACRIVTDGDSGGGGSPGPGGQTGINSSILLPAFVGF
ncbi:MAG: hypothetical protein KF777_15765 [Planctomycetaceae bacterium]|nr:hypothetical protein [Planctomycetaceae bacterium]